MAFNKIIFPIGMNMMLLPALFGNKDLFHYFFGASIWDPLAKISFCTYLVHFFICLANDKSLY